MFRGLHAIQMDSKGRLAVPTLYRELLVAEANGKMIVTIDTEMACLLLYPLPAWEVIEKKIEALPSFNRTARRIQRLLIGHATEIELDSHGRLLLPQPLRSYAGLDKAIVLVGQGKKFEIWDETRWNTERSLWLSEIDTKGEELSGDMQTFSL